MYDIRNRVCIVTGSGRGIGKAIAMKLASEGGKIVVNVRKSINEGEQTLKEIDRISSGMLVTADVSTEAGRELLFAKTEENLGTPEILINNAGVGILEPLGGIEEKNLELMFRTNLFSPLRLSERFMKDSHGGVIINMASLAGINPFPGLAVYGATKSALIGLTKYMSLEMASYGIRVNAVAPGVVKTRMGDGLLNLMNLDEAEFSKKFTLTGKLITPEDVADAVIFLIKNESITGQVITIDSGSTQMATDYFK
ncbi:MAG: SDR family oxidoreductase [Ferroplasma sp.]|uniref:SDR family NAD(P)-dependent oxidoreductase n=1 Tax=Ferroplasma sp. TaxID=2591003 RepID=UPI002814DB28|nr:SDR family NAD(P)-dependent oxidoreductase [Ferroplasma sp.]WMT50409.1 MAG: SDR family oxidoreductase [Ferroplasma sp.]